jgi:two-component system response regulator FlrC
MARVLMVDDDEMERVYAAEVLRWGGHEPVFAPNGDVALKVLAQGEVDVVVTDLAMPGLDGISLIRRIREADQLIPIVAISGVHPEQLKEAERLGAGQTFSKPWDPRALVEAVDRLHTEAKARAAGPVFEESDFLD